MKKILLAALVLCNSAAFAEPIPPELAYPPYSRKADKITLQNLQNEFRSRRWSHMMMERDNVKCWRMQRRLNKAIEEMRNDKAPVPKINDQVAISESSPLAKYRKASVLKAFPDCSFASYGNLDDETGTLYCKIHGTEFDFRSKFAQKHKTEFMQNRPFINAADVLEFLYVLPSLLLLLITTFIMNKIL